MSEITGEHIADILSPYNNLALALRTHEEIADDDARVKVSRAKLKKQFAELNVLLSKIHEITFIPEEDSKEET